MSNTGEITQISPEVEGVFINEGQKATERGGIWKNEGCKPE